MAILLRANECASPSMRHRAGTLFSMLCHRQQHGQASTLFDWLGLQNLRQHIHLNDLSAFLFCESHDFGFGFGIFGEIDVQRHAAVGR